MDTLKSEKYISLDESSRVSENQIRYAERLDKRPQK